MYNRFVLVFLVFSVLSESFPSVTVVTKNNYIVLNHHYLNKSVYTGKEYFELEAKVHEKTLQVNEIYSKYSIEFLVGSFSLSQNIQSKDGINVFWTLDTCPFVDYENTSLYLCHNDTFVDLANSIRSLGESLNPLILNVNITAQLSGDSLVIYGNTNRNPMFWAVYREDNQLGVGYDEKFDYSIPVEHGNYSYIVSVCYDYEYPGYEDFCYQVSIDDTISSEGLAVYAKFYPIVFLLLMCI